MGIEDKKPGDRTYYVYEYTDGPVLESAVYVKETEKLYVFSQPIYPWQKKHLEKRFDQEEIEGLHWTPADALRAYIEDKDRKIARQTGFKRQACELLQKAEQKA